VRLAQLSDRLAKAVANAAGKRASAQYREFAEECDRLAQEAKTEHHRKILEEMAEAWRRVAGEVDNER
jgi:MoxR-like ATPase